MPVLSDPIGDLLTRIRNAQRAKRTSCRAPWSRIKQQLLELLQKEGWISSVTVVGEDPFKELDVVFSPDRPMLELTRVSKPGRRVYSSFSTLRPVLNGFGIAVLTTSAGLMTDREARKRKVGGEVLCTIS